MSSLFMAWTQPPSGNFNLRRALRELFPAEIEKNLRAVRSFGGLIGATVRDLVGGVFGASAWAGRIHFDIDGMDGAVLCGWGEGDAVFVANELRDLAISFLERFGIFGEVGAATSGIGDGFE